MMTVVTGDYMYARDYFLTHRDQFNFGPIFTNRGQIDTVLLEYDNCESAILDCISVGFPRDTYTSKGMQPMFSLHPSSCMYSNMSCISRFSIPNRF